MAHTTTTLPGRKHTTLRVLVLDQGPGLWGAQRYLLRLYPLLAGHGVELTLACPPELEQYDHWRSAGMPVIGLSLPTARSIRNESRISPRQLVAEARRSASIPRLIAQTAIRGRYDLVLANSHWTHLDAALAARVWRVPTVLTLHETSVPGLGRGLRDLAIRLAGHAVAVSESVAADVGSSVRQQVTVIPNGVDTTAFTPSGAASRGATRRELGVADDDRLVLAATRIDPSKHIEDIIALAAELDAKTSVIVAGASSAHHAYERTMRAEADVLPPGRLRFLGARDDISRLLGAADLFVHTGLIEGMPLGLIEAQSAGVPVVAYEAAGVRESVCDGRTGYVVGPRDIDGLVDGVCRLLSDDDLRAEFGVAARAHVLDHHRLDGQAATTARLLRTICWSEQPSRAGAV